jgi:hypothetical protein
MSLAAARLPAVRRPDVAMEFHESLDLLLVVLRECCAKLGFLGARSQRT